MLGSYENTLNSYRKITGNFKAKLSADSSILLFDATKVDSYNNPTDTSQKFFNEDHFYGYCDLIK